MINRKQVESILKINGVTPASPDEHIRSVLLSARYSDDEVETAIMVLRQNDKTNETRVHGLHKVFRTDEALKPDEVSALLGVNIEVSDRIEAKSIEKTKNRGTLDRFQFISVWILSVVLASIALLFYMYMIKVGPFHIGMAV